MFFSQSNDKQKSTNDNRQEISDNEVKEEFKKILVQARELKQITERAEKTAMLLNTFYSSYIVNLMYLHRQGDKNTFLNLLKENSQQMDYVQNIKRVLAADEALLEPTLLSFKYYLTSMIQNDNELSVIYNSSKP